MHIGFASSESPYCEGGGGGISSYLQTLIPAIVKSGHRVTLVAFADKPEKIQLLGGNLRVVHLKQPSLHWYFSRAGAVGRWVALWIRQLEWSLYFYRAFEAVNARDPLDIIEGTEVGGLKLHRIAPTVIRLHGTQFVFDAFMSRKPSRSTRLEMQLQKKTYCRAAALSSPSEFQADQVRKITNLDVKTVIIPNPLDEFWVRASDQNEERIRQDDPPMLLFVGRLAPVKGVQILLQALPLLKDVPLRCVLAGEWQMPEEPSGYGIDPKHRWRSRILWLGHLDRLELVEYYRKASLFIMPSFYETFGLSVVEAMMMGVPVVASRAGALQERIQHQANGLLFPPGDPHALAACVRSALDHPEELERLGRAGQMSVRSQYSPQSAAQKTIAAYQEIMKAEG